MKRVFLPLLLVTIVLGGCIKSTDLRGYTFDPDMLAMVVEGKSSKDDVLAKLGSPSTVSNLGGNTWYYVSRKSEYVAFFKPKTVEQTIYAIDFDSSDMVNTIKTYSKADARDIKLASDVTPTAGHDMGFAEQLLGNVGRFNSDPARPGARQ